MCSLVLYGLLRSTLYLRNHPTAVASGWGHPPHKLACQVCTTLFFRVDEGLHTKNLLKYQEYRLVIHNESPVTEQILT